MLVANVSPPRVVLAQAMGGFELAFIVDGVRVPRLGQQPIIWFRPDLARIRIGVRINGDGLDAEAARGGGDTAGDFAAIGNQDFLEHELGRRFWMIWALWAALFPWPYREQVLSVLDGLPIIHQLLNDLAGDISFDLVHQLHRLNNA